MQCRGYPKGGIAAHDAPESEFSAGKNQCKTCVSAYFADWRKSKSASQPALTNVQRDNAVKAAIRAQSPATADLIEHIENRVALVQRDPITSNGHTYRPVDGLEETFMAVVESTRKGHPLSLAIHGPSGSGKTDGMRYLAAKIGRPLVKIDCKSMIDAESFFGTRGALDGSTFYTPSLFVQALTQPCVLFLDEYNRITSDVRDVLNPLLDGTRCVLNPITGEVVYMHPDVIVVLAGNMGYRFVGTQAVDPALTSRVVIFEMDYPDEASETAILQEVAKNLGGVSADWFLPALVRFGRETRTNPQMVGIGTRQLISAVALAANGSSLQRAVEFACINSVEDDGSGATSSRATMLTAWAAQVPASEQPAQVEREVADVSGEALG